MVNTFADNKFLKLTDIIVMPQSPQAPLEVRQHRDHNNRAKEPIPYSKYLNIMTKGAR